MLTLVAMLCSENRGLPPRRVDLYREGIKLLLECGHRAEKRGVKEPESARRLLSAMSLLLQETGKEVWTKEELDQMLWSIRRSTVELNETWGTNQAFLDYLSRNAGILAPHDGPREPWRYLHRSFREFLTAEALAKEGIDAITARAEKLGKEDIGRWGETFALTAGLTGAPIKLLERLREVSPTLALDALCHVDAESPKALLDFLWTIPRDDSHEPDWNGDYLLRLVRAWSLPSETTAGHLWNLVVPGRSIEVLAYIHHALDQIGEPPDREAFFKACGRPLKNLPEIRFVPIPAGKFMMGSPEGDPDATEAERPRHEVSVKGFELAETLVTNRQYAPFDPSHKSAGGPEAPVSGVNWWRSYLYASWMECRLPTEAEWEYADLMRTPCLIHQIYTEISLSCPGVIGFKAFSQFFEFVQ